MAVLAFAGGGLFNAAIAEWRARASEDRAKTQRSEEWTRQLEADKLARLRGAVIRDLQETRAYFLADEASLLARAEGRVLPYPGPEYPNQDLSMTGDPALVAEQATVVTEFLIRAPGSGVPAELMVKAAALHSAIIRELKNQEARALADQPLRELTVDQQTAAAMQALQARLLEGAKPSG